MQLKMKHIFNIDNVFATILVIVILKFFPVFFNIDMFDPIQNTFEDMQITDLVFSQVKDYSDVGIDSNIVIINNGHLDRMNIAELIYKINEKEPKLIALDAFFRAEKGPEQDEPLKDAFSEVDNLILVNELTDTNDDSEFDSLKTSNPMFNQYAMNGYANVYIADGDFKTVRQIKPFTKVNDKIIPSISSKVVEIYDKDKFERYKNRNNELEVINYKRNIDKYLTYNYSEILNEEIDYEHFKGKIVLIGYLGPELGKISTEDIFYTPMNKNYSGKTNPDMYGVVIHANVISMILEEDYIYRTSDALAFVLMILVVYINMILFNYWRRNEELLIWYQPYTILLILGELIGFSFLMVLLMHWFKIELRFAASFFAITVTVLSYELFTDSLKPLVMGYVKRYQFNKERKNNIKENNGEERISNDELFKNLENERKNSTEDKIEEIELENIEKVDKIENESLEDENIEEIENETDEDTKDETDKKSYNDENELEDKDAK
jgi:CHASE2 domain-containing sensor protein